jgi:ribosomal-protein-alanine N-acetyltransferase
MLQEGNIILRLSGEKDIDILTELANNKNVSSYLRDYFPFPYNISDAETFINLTKLQKPVTSFAIEFDGKFCCIIGLVKQNDVYRKSAEIGYWLGEHYWKKGIITIAVKLITGYGFNQLDLIRIFASVFENNIGSMRALERNGYQKEGILKKAIFKNGQVWDEHRYAITI